MYGLRTELRAGIFAQNLPDLQSEGKTRESTEQQLWWLILKLVSADCSVKSVILRAYSSGGEVVLQNLHSITFILVKLKVRYVLCSEERLIL